LLLRLSEQFSYETRWDNPGYDDLPEETEGSE